MHIKQLALALFSGLLLSLAWPTYGFAGLIFFGFVPLLILFNQLRYKNTKRILLKSFVSAYLSFFVFNFITTYWLYYSSGFGMWFAVLVNSALMALVFMIYQAIALRTSHRNSIIFLIALWIGFEKLHLHWEFSWPWLNLGNAFSEHINWVQWYEYTGTFGGTLWVLIINALMYNAYLKWKNNQFSNVLHIIPIISIIVLPILLSLLIKSSYGDFKENVEVVVLQPNIDPYEDKYYTADSDISKILTELIANQKPINDAVILSPETVFAGGTWLSQFYASPAFSFSQDVLELYPDATLLNGISMAELIKDTTKIKPQTNLSSRGYYYNDFNSAFFVKADQPVEFYHKSKLVVGVENFPYQAILKPILGDIMLDLGGTVAMKTTQTQRSVFQIKDEVFIAPIICYESVYGEFVTGFVNNGASILGIITNDAWWQDSQGHKQHFSYGKLRAIETRRSIARSANTGISGFIDPLGQVISKSNYDEKTSLKSRVPITRKITFYVQHGDYIARIAYFFILFISIFALIKHKRKVKR